MNPHEGFNSMVSIWRDANECRNEIESKIRLKRKTNSLIEEPQGLRGEKMVESHLGVDSFLMAQFKELKWVTHQISRLGMKTKEENPHEVNRNV